MIGTKTLAIPILGYLSNKLHRRLLNMCLKVLESHITNQQEFDLFVYNRKTDDLVPIVWKARGVTAPKQNNPTNDWEKLEELYDYSDKLVVDVGSNRGGTVARFSRTAKQVLAFEPHPENFNFLEDQIKIRALKNVDIFQLALSDFTGEAEFFGRESHGIHSLGVHNKGRVTETFKIKVTELDEFLPSKTSEKVGLLKVDVEGFEADVFRRAENLFKERMIEAVVFEFSPLIHKLRKTAVDEPIAVLEEFGYQVFDLEGKPFKYDPSNSPKICDLIAFPKK